MSSNALLFLTEINNRGCQFLDRGDISNAMACFRQALADVKAYLRKTHGMTSQVEQQQQQEQQGRRNILPMAADVLRRQGMLSASCCSSAKTGSGSSVIHSHAIRMIPHFRFSPDGLENGKIYTAIVVFNLALTAHFQGLRSGFRSHLGQAKSLYYHTYQLIMDILVGSYQGCATGNALVDLLTLGLYNNMALLFMEFSEYSESAEIFQHLLVFATSISSPRQGDLLFSPEDHKFICRLIHFFMLNATTLGLEPPLAAAAA